MTFSRPTIKLIAADMDGTLLNSHSQVSSRTSRIIKEAQQRGVVFALSTGRFVEDASMQMMDAEIDCPMISLNGAMIADSPFGRVLSEKPLPPETARLVFDMLEQMGEGYFIFGRRTVTTRRKEVKHHSETQFGERIIKQSGARYFDGIEACRRALGETVYKFYVYVGDNKARLAEVRQALLRIPGLTITQSSNTNLEIMRDNVDKGTGLEELCGILGIPLSQSMAIGDQDNDLPMLRRAGWSVAMDNATDEVKREANHVTGSNDEDGVAQAIEQFVLS